LYVAPAPVKVVRKIRRRFAPGFLLAAPPLTGAGTTWTRLVRKARRNFQPELSAIRFNRKPRKRQHQANGRKNFKIFS
jgi:hypothetical protein